MSSLHENLMMVPLVMKYLCNKRLNVVVATGRIETLIKTLCQMSHYNACMGEFPIKVQQHCVYLKELQMQYCIVIYFEG